uniref:Coilin n=1 Tax=Latimeria chalumnae TaxID=7897 RepID=H3A824_LATCH
MAVSSVSGAVRVRLVFDYPPPLTPECRMCWLFVDLNKFRVVTDLASIIRQKFGFSNKAILNLFIEDCLLPPNESIYVVRDNDCIRVKLEDLIPAENGSDLHDSSCYSTKKTKKRHRHGSLEKGHLESEDEEHKKKKKRDGENALEFVREVVSNRSCKKKRKKKGKGSSKEDEFDTDDAPKKKNKQVKGKGLENGLEEKHLKKLDVATSIKAGLEHATKNLPSQIPKQNGNNNNSATGAVKKAAKASAQGSSNSSSDSSDDEHTNKRKKGASQATVSKNQGCSVQTKPQHKKTAPLKLANTSKGGKRKTESSSSDSDSDSSSDSASPTLKSKPGGNDGTMSSVDKCIPAVSQNGEKPKTAKRSSSSSDSGSSESQVQEISIPRAFGRGCGRGERFFNGRGPRGRGQRGGFRGRGRGESNQLFYNYDNVQTQQYVNEVATNSSVIIQNPAEITKRDYSALPLLAAPPQAGEKIAFKLLELTENYTPEVSEYKEGRIVDYNPITKQLKLEILSTRAALKEPGKFDLVYQREDGAEVIEYAVSQETVITESWDTLLEPRLIVEPRSEATACTGNAPIEKTDIKKPNTF